MIRSTDIFDFSSQKLLFNPLFILRTIFLKPLDGADILTVFYRAEGKLDPNCSDGFCSVCNSIFKMI